MNTAIISNTIICDKKLPDGPFLVYCVLAMEAGLNEDTFACTILDFDVFKKNSLSDNAFRLYSFLAMYAGNTSNHVILKQSEIPQLTNKTRKTVQRAMNELISKGVIEIGEGDLFIIHDRIRNNLEG